MGLSGKYYGTVGFYNPWLRGFPHVANSKLNNLNVGDRIFQVKLITAEPLVILLFRDRKSSLRAQPHGKHFFLESHLPQTNTPATRWADRDGTEVRKATIGFTPLKNKGRPTVRRKKGAVPFFISHFKNNKTERASPNIDSTNAIRMRRWALVGFDVNSLHWKTCLLSNNHISMGPQVFCSSNIGFNNISSTPQTSTVGNQIKAWPLHSGFWWCHHIKEVMPPPPPENLTWPNLVFITMVRQKASGFNIIWSDLEVFCLQNPLALDSKGQITITSPTAPSKCLSVLSSHLSPHFGPSSHIFCDAGLTAGISSEDSSPLRASPNQGFEGKLLPIGQVTI